MEKYIIHLTLKKICIITALINTRQNWAKRPIRSTSGGCRAVRAGWCVPYSQGPGAAFLLTPRLQSSQNIGIPTDPNLLLTSSKIINYLVTDQRTDQASWFLVLFAANYIPNEPAFWNLLSEEISSCAFCYFALGSWVHSYRNINVVIGAELARTWYSLTLLCASSSPKADIINGAENTLPRAQLSFRAFPTQCSGSHYK